MSDNEVIELDVWKGDWGLSSVTADCLQVLTYARLAKIPIKLNTHSNPYRTPHGQFPVLRCGCIQLDKVSDILEFFKKRNYNLDHPSDECDQCIDILAYSCLVKEKLAPALHFLWWVDKKNLEEFVRPWFCQAMPFPFKFYYAGKFERNARDFFDGLYSNNEEVDIETKIYSDAQKCMTYFSSLFQETDFFFGDKPTLFDTILYSYLAPIYYAELPNAALKNHLIACKPLANFVTAMTQRCFASEVQQYQERKIKERAVKMAQNNDGDYPNKRRNQILAAFFVTVTMLSYVLSTGIVQVSEDDASEEFEDYELDNEDEK